MKKKRKKNKTKIMIIIVVILLYLIFLIVGLVINYRKNQQDKENAIKHYLVIDNFLNLKYSNHSWSRATTTEIENYAKKYSVYNKNQYFGQYQLKYGTVWNLFDQNNSYVDYEGGLFAYSDNFDVSLKETNLRSISNKEKQEINDYFNYQDFNSIIIGDVLDVDFDHNGVMDSIVCVSNIGIESTDVGLYYSLVYVNYNGEIIEIINQNSSNCDILRAEVYQPSNVFHADKKGYFAIKRIIGIDSDALVEKAILYDYTDINEIKEVNIQ